MERVGRRDTCWSCGADLHCCLNCRFQDATQENQCLEPQAERQVDKTIGNFCEYFEFRLGRRSNNDVASAAKAKLDVLFGKKKAP